MKIRNRGDFKLEGHEFSPDSHFCHHQLYHHHHQPSLHLTKEFSHTILFILKRKKKLTKMMTE